MASAYCPDCDNRIVLNSHPRVGQTITCPSCDTDLEVIGLNPLEFDFVYDWSWEDDEEEEDDD